MAQRKKTPTVTLTESDLKEGGKELAEKVKDALGQVKIVPFERQLLCVLTDDEKAKYAEQAAHVLLARDELEAQAKAAAAAMKNQVKEQDDKLRSLSEKVRMGREMRLTPCETRYIYRTGSVIEVRTDTGEQLSERAMTVAEKQIPLDFSKLPAGDTAKAILDMFEELDEGDPKMLALEELYEELVDANTYIDTAVDALVEAGKLRRYKREGKCDTLELLR